MILVLRSRLLRHTVLWPMDSEMKMDPVRAIRNQSISIMTDPQLKRELDNLGRNNQLWKIKSNFRMN